VESPHDVGIAHVVDEGNGRTTVFVCATLEGNTPKGVIARHSHVRALDVRPGVTLRTNGADRSSVGNVIVFNDGSATVHILPPDGEEKLVEREGIIAAAPLAE
jgi:hypothetical protein